MDSPISYYLASPIIRESVFSEDDSLEGKALYIFEPKWDIQPCGRFDIPNFHATHEIEIIWPYLIFAKKADERVRFICQQIIIVSPPIGHDLNKWLWNIIFLAYISYSYEYITASTGKKINSPLREFEEALTYFDIPKMVSILNSKSQ